MTFNGQDRLKQGRYGKNQVKKFHSKPSNHYKTDEFSHG